MTLLGVTVKSAWRVLVMLLVATGVTASTVGLVAVTVELELETVMNWLLVLTLTEVVSAVTVEYTGEAVEIDERAGVTVAMMLPVDRSVSYILSV